MTIYEIYKDILSIKRRLIEILKDFNDNKIAYYNYSSYKNELYNLYRKYLKLYVLYSSNNIGSNDKWPYKNNCYFYALNLPTPDIFIDTYEAVFLDSFYFDIGSISKLPILDDDNFNINTFLDYMYSDLDTLDIKYYLSSINAPLKHDGYKIAVFYDSYKKDYHFIRQNKDGLWSQKYGLIDTISISDNPLSFLNNLPFEYHHDYPFNYEYIQTLELVKPTIK